MKMESRIKDVFPRILFQGIDRRTMNVMNNLGAAVIFFALAFLGIFRPKQIREIVRKVFYVGTKSSNIVMLIDLFTALYTMRIDPLRYLVSSRITASIIIRFLSPPEITVIELVP
jgi:ABC-type transporter Mla maintaining outer membrane lipid asymmetry permease subunit MlaE